MKKLSSKLRALHARPVIYVVLNLAYVAALVTVEDAPVSAVVALAHLLLYAWPKGG